MCESVCQCMCVCVCVCDPLILRGEGNFPYCTWSCSVVKTWPLWFERPLMKDLCFIFTPYIYDISPYVSSMNLALKSWHHQLVVCPGSPFALKADLTPLYIYICRSFWLIGLCCYLAFKLYLLRQLCIYLYYVFF